METAEALRHVRELTALAAEREEAARHQLADARHRRAFWQQPPAKLEAGQPANALLLLRREEAALRCRGEAATLEALIAT